MIIFFINTLITTPASVFTVLHNAKLVHLIRAVLLTSKMWMVSKQPVVLSDNGNLTFKQATSQGFLQPFIFLTL